MTNTPDYPATGDNRPEQEPADSAGQRAEPNDSTGNAGQPTQPSTPAAQPGSGYSTPNPEQRFGRYPVQPSPEQPMQPTQRFGQPQDQSRQPSPDQTGAFGHSAPQVPRSGVPLPPGAESAPGGNPQPTGATPPPGAAFGAPLGAVPPPPGSEGFGGPGGPGGTGGPGGPGQYHGPGGGWGNGEPSKKRTIWAPVVSVAAVTALVVGVATGLVFNALDDNNATPTSISSIGQDGSGDSNPAPVTGSDSQNPDWEAVDKAVASSVVAIQVDLSDGEAEGSGVIIDSKGHIVTNNHVVNGAQNNEVQVTLNDGRIYTAKVVGTDSTTDLAVVQVQDPPSDLKAASFGDSSKIRVGESVMAVGNPLGLANTATTGIVSATNRPVSASGETSSSAVVTNAIQIDAAVNPGNSGGPLFNAQGQVIGITSSIATMSSGLDSSSGSIGLGFAIPSNLVQNISGQLIKSGTAEHAFLGVGLNDGTATADGVTRQGALVTSLTSGSPADKAGIQKGDVIVAIDGQPVSGAESLTGYVREESAGQKVTLTLVRDGKSLDVNVTLAVKTAADDSTPSQAPLPGDSGGSGNGFDFGGQG